MKIGSIKKINLAIDTGYGNIKAAHLQEDGNTFWLDSFPSFFIQMHKGLKRAEDIRDTRRIVVVEDQEFIVGTSAVASSLRQENRTSSYTSSLAYRAMTLGMCAEAAEALGSTTIETLSLGLPLDAFKVEDIRLHLKSSIRGKHSMTSSLSGQKYTLHVERVKVFPQGQGAYFFFTAALPDSQHLPTATTIIDIGSGTTDWLRAEGDRLNLEDSDSIAHAASHLKLLLQRQLSLAGYLRLADSQIEDLLHKCWMKANDQKLSLQQLQPIIEPTLDQFVSDLKSKIKCFDDDVILLSGGLAKFLHPTFSKMYSGNAVVTTGEDPIFDNAKGFALQGGSFK